MIDSGGFLGPSSIEAAEAELGVPCVCPWMASEPQENEIGWEQGQLRLGYGTRKARVKEKRGGTCDLPESQATVICGLPSREQLYIRQGVATRRWVTKSV